MLTVLLSFAVACGSSAKPVARSIDPTPVPADAAPIVVAIDAGTSPDAGAVVAVEQPDPTPITTVKEYEYQPAQRLPAVTGTAAFKPLGTPRTVRIAINTWAGWAPLVWANRGAAAKQVWKDARGGQFLVELVVMDNPTAMVDAFAAGELHAGWASVDMLPLVVERLKHDPRTMPRVYQLVDWSNGGDGIVVRGAIKQVSDLRGKTIVLAQASPSHYFLLDMLLDAGLQPSDVTLKFTRDAFQAAAAFNQSKAIDAVVTWAPDLDSLARAPGNRVLVTTAIANKLIADVWFARADFAKANPHVIEALVRGELDAAVALDDAAARQGAAKLLDTVFGLPSNTSTKMFADVYLANHADNREFLLDRNSPTSFERTYENARSLYRAIKAVDKTVAFDKLVDFSIIKKLGGEARYRSHVSKHVAQFTPAASIDIDRAILTKTVAINFYPNSFDIWKKVAAPAGGEVLYDPTVDRTIADIAKLAGKFGGARIHVGGFTDASMKGMADEHLVRDLSAHRATAVKDALVQKHKIDPNQLAAQGFGWDRPADPNDPANHAKNRRVEIRVVPATPP